MPPSMIQSCHHSIDTSLGLLLHLPIPQPNHSPASSSELGINPTIPLDIPGDLRPPIRAEACRVLTTVPVPQKPVDEYCYVPTTETDIRASDRGGVVATPPSDPPSPEGSPKAQLGARVSSSHLGHGGAARRR